MRRNITFLFTIMILALLVLTYPQVSLSQDRYVYLRSFPEGPGFDSPYDLAVDGSGNIYVADTNNHRIQKFSRFGDLIAMWGAWGSGDGQLRKPWGIAVDKSGYVYVADSDNSRIQKFTSSGSFVMKFGKRGTANGQMIRPTGITVDQSGNIYIADTDNNRVQKFNSNGIFMKAWGSNGSNDGQTPYPEGIAVDSEGNVYLADAWNGRIQKFNTNGTFLMNWGEQGYATGDFIGPRGVAVDKNGYVYVSDTRNSRIQKFDSEGNFLAAWGSLGNSEGKFNNPRGIEISPYGDICVADWGNNRIQILDSTGVYFAKWGIGGSDNGHFLLPKAAALDPYGNIYVADTNNHRVQKISQNGSYIAKWGTKGSGNGQFSYPSGIAVDQYGNVYVSDLGNCRIQKFDANGGFMTKWGTSGAGNGQFMSPFGVAVDQSDNVYVADWFNNRIQKFDSNGVFLKKWGQFGGLDGDFAGPRGVAVDQQGSVYVADTDNHRIQKFTPDGVFLGKWGRVGNFLGTGDGEFWTPWGLTTDGSGNIYVADTGNNRIQKFNKNGQFIGKWGTGGDALSRLRSPYDVVANSSGSSVYVADTGNQCVKEYIKSSGNIAPIANSKVIVCFEDTSIDFILTGRDPDGSSVTFRITSQPKSGKVTGNTPNLTYTPNSNFTGEDSFTFVVSDGYAESSTAVVNITVFESNDAPSADPKAVTTEEDKAVDIVLTGSDPDEDTLTFSIVKQPQNGILSGTPPNVTYTPNADFGGTDSFTYVANDGISNSPEETVTISVGSVDDPPIADSPDKPIELDEDSMIQITLTGKDPEGKSITFAITDYPKNGTLSGVPPTVLYTPNDDFSGKDEIKFTVSDGVLTSEKATIQITVKPANDKPIANNMSVTTKEDTFIRITLTATDIDAQIQTLGFEVVNKPKNGVLSSKAPYLIYTPNKDFFGTDSFTFTAQDSYEKSDPATVTITVEPVNDIPIAKAQFIEIDEDEKINIVLSGSDPDGEELIYKIATNPTDGALLGTEPNMEYTPNLNYYGDDYFSFVVSDGIQDSNIAKINIRILPINDAPIANPQEVTTSEETTINITLSSKDAESDPPTYKITKYPTKGYLSGNPPDMQYKPFFGFFGTDTFAFTASDVKAESEPATVTITVNKINDAPLATSQSVMIDEDTPKNITLAGIDADGDELTFTIVDPPTNGSLEETEAGLIYTPNKDFSGNDSFTFTASDGEAESKPATVNIRVSPMDDPPSAEAQTVTVDEDSEVKITLTGNDPEGDTFSLEVASQPTNGSLEGTPPELLYKPKENFDGEDSFTFVATNGKVKSEPAKVTIIVNPVNHAPIAKAQSVSTDQDMQVKITLLGTDIDEDDLTYQIIDQPPNGRLEGEMPEIIYIPKSGFSGEDGFTFIVSDGALISESAKVSITVNKTNSPPTAISQIFQIEENKFTVFTLEGTDDDGDKLTFEVKSQPSNGTLSGDSPQLVYTPNKNFTGMDSFTFAANDGKIDSDIVTIEFDVTAIADPWDVNRDGYVNILDLVSVNIYYGKTDFPLSQNPDVNRDGKVDSKDIALVIEHFGNKKS